MNLINNILEACKSLVGQCKRRSDTFESNYMILVNGPYGLV